MGKFEVVSLLFITSMLIGSIRSDDFQPLRIAAFNVQVFGVSKMSKPMVPEILTKIILRYDIILIQEVRDSTGQAIQDLLYRVNTADALEKQQDASCDAEKSCDNIDGDFDMVISERLGRSSSKEQYAYIYRKSRVSVTDSYHYDDGLEEDSTDHYEREPFIVRFHSPFTDVKDFAIGGIHTKPDDAVSEIDRLADVYDDIVKRWSLEDVLIAGDYNAACSYVKSDDWKNIRLRSQERFLWLIADNVDTNVAGDICAYDRLVVGGDLMKRAVWPGSAREFLFDKEYGLTDEQTSEVSDHYPVEMLLLPEVSDAITKHITTHSGFAVTDDRDVDESSLQAFAAASSTTELKIDAFFDGNGQLKKITALQSISGIQDAVATLERFNSEYPGIVSMEIIDVVAAHAKQFSLQADHSVVLTRKKSKQTKLLVTCSVEETATCGVAVRK
ncbi:deoxyribonuclease-1-like [Saccoglossus kowalevskii]|uniref:Deoxyribonuclease-1-like n=1 Tax=Saccoglossus kowalevskii TaxID=10224 RepID=A0ABM0MHD1_SACKO|nr:PREDICTED: deoxyribonuclease-1-like [Saccoglossus kowalevskii]